MPLLFACLSTFRSISPSVRKFNGQARRDRISSQPMQIEAQNDAHSAAKGIAREETPKKTARDSLPKAGTATTSSPHNAVRLNRMMSGWSPC